MTNHWTDLNNTDVFLIIGSNAAENHPISFHWVSKAMERGAKLIHVDPRFNRTSALADIYAPIRPGTDIAFIGGMIKYVLDNELYHRDYVVAYTNASLLVDPNFSFQDGLFSGYDATKRSYTKTTWQYQLDATGIPKRDPTLQDPNCVFQIMKRHYARYDADTVCKITGTPKDVYLQVCSTFGATGVPNKVGNILYAMGTTQHTVGTMNVTSYAYLQLLLGNVGVAGGGIQAMRGESNVQGSTDAALLFHLLPGYLPCPVNTDASLQAYLNRARPKVTLTALNADPKSVDWCQNYPKYMTSLLKAWYGASATAANDFGFHYLPKTSGGNYSWIPLFEAMGAGVVKGLMCWGQNPAVSGPNLSQERGALRKLDWLVVADLWETETAAFWKAPGIDPKTINTEVFMLPACASYEKQGSVSNSGRWVQWRYKGIDPPGNAQDDLWIMDKLMLKLKELYASQGGPNAEAITNLTWGYGEHADPVIVAKEINGYDLTTGKLMANFVGLRNDGTTTCGNWIMSGSFTEAGNMMARRNNVDTSGIGLYSGWAWCWPVNRRILYNRASVDPSGNPWDPKRVVVTWNPVTKAWSGDVVDGAGTKGPDEVYPFIMNAEGQGRIFALGYADGPMPEHYEPWETPTPNLMSSVQLDPVVKVWRPAEQGTPDKYPIVATTFRVTEHWQAGAMTRTLPWLTELMPKMFVELSEELAREKGIANGSEAVVESSRGRITAVAMVTKRLKPMVIDGKTVHVIAIPWHWGYMGLSKGDSANILTPHIGDANTTMPEYKAFLVNVSKPQAMGMGGRHEGGE